MNTNALKLKVKALAPVVAIAAALIFALPRAGAQKTPVIVLDESSPTADVTISLENGAPGAVVVDMQNVALSLKAASGETLLAVNDPRITALGFQIAQDAPVETLHLERAPGVAVAQARVVALPTLTTLPTLPDAALSASAPAASAPQPIVAGPGSAPLESAPLESAPLDIAPAAPLSLVLDGTNNRLSLTAPNGESVVQILDQAGSVLLNARAGGATNGLMVQLAEGQYTLVAGNGDPRAANAARLTLSAGQPSSLGAPPAPQQAAAPVSACEALALSAAVVRSGPGTAYSALGVANAGERLAVGGVNREGGWLLVQGGAGSAWLPADASLLSGQCAALPAYDIPLRNSTFQAFGGAPNTTQPFAFSDEEHERDEGEGEEEGEYDD